MVMERCIQTVVGTYEEVKAIENEFDALEAKFGNVSEKTTLLGILWEPPIWHDGLGT